MQTTNNFVRPTKPAPPKVSWRKRLLWSLGAGLPMGILCVVLLASRASATGMTFDLTTDGTGGMGSMQLLFVFALLAVAPSLLIMMTSFTRIVIVFSFLRNAIGLQQTPPNQVIIGLALFLSLFIMRPVLADINENAMQPFLNDQITQDVALDRMQQPIKEFMLKQIKTEELNLFLDLSGSEQRLTSVEPDQLMSLGMSVVIPAFITSELKRAFTIGFLLFLPFLVIDMIVSSTLMSMGMVMLPPSMISLPFKLMLFVVVDGWSLMMEMLVRGFRM